MLLPVCLFKKVKYLCKIFTKFAAKFHTHTLLFELFHCHFVTNPTNGLFRCSVQRDVARRLILIAKLDKWQFVVKT